MRLERKLRIPDGVSSLVVKVLPVQGFDAMPTTVYVKVVSDGLHTVMECRTIYCGLRAYDAAVRELPKVLRALPPASLHIVAGDFFTGLLFTGSAPCPTNTCRRGYAALAEAVRRFSDRSLSVVPDDPDFCAYRAWAEDKYRGPSSRAHTTHEQSGAAFADYLAATAALRRDMRLWR